MDRYILTARDIEALYADIDISELELPDVQPTYAKINRGETNDPLDDAALRLAQAGEYAQAVAKQQNHIDRLIRQRIEKRIADPVKRRVLNAKITERVKIGQPDLTVSTTEGAISAKTSAALASEIRSFRRFGIICSPGS
jgi:hypothetical protein